MSERFTDRAREVMKLANQEAQRLNHEYIGTEHILLGLVKEGAGVAAAVLKNFDIELRQARLEVEKLVQSGPDVVTMGTLPQTARAKKVIEFAMEEARTFNHNYVGTEHLLLGLLREKEGVGAQVLINLGLKLEEVRKEILDLLGYGSTDETPDPVLASPSDPVAGKTTKKDSLQCITFVIYCATSGVKQIDHKEINSFLASNVDIKAIHQSSTATQTHISFFYRDL